MLNFENYHSYQAGSSDSIVDDKGFLLDTDSWSEAFAANALGLPTNGLQAGHLKVIYFVRDKYAGIGALPPMRRVCKSTGLDKLEIKILFGSCMNLLRAAGLPRPSDEVTAHMN